MKNPRVMQRVVLVMCLGGLLPLGSSVEAQTAEDPAAAIKLIPFRSELIFGFDNSRESETQRLRLDASGPMASGSPTAVILADFFSSTGRHSLSLEEVDASVEVDPDSQTLLLTVVANPSLESWNAGEYTSSLRIQGDGYEAMTIPITLSFRSGPEFWGVGAAFLVLAFSAFVGVLFKPKTASTRKLPAVSAGWWTRNVVSRAPFLTG
ncbi:MAG: hypothetical protein ACRDH9_12915, partial [Actinomycetota bacterium]